MSFWSSPSRDRLVRLLALLGVGRREALHQLAGDPDHDLGRPEAGHLLGLLERDRAVVDDRGDVGDGARLHVREALSLAPDAADRPVTGGVDIEHERLGELRPDVERGAGGEGLVAVALPDPAPEGHQAPVSSAAAMAASAAGKTFAARALALGHLRAGRHRGRRSRASRP